jgi:hypothetical protein
LQKNIRGGKQPFCDVLCQVLDPGKDAIVDEHYDQLFHLARKQYIIPGCTKVWNCYASIQDIFLLEEICFSESFSTGTKAPLQVNMATEHDSMLFQPEDDSR